LQSIHCKLDQAFRRLREPPFSPAPVCTRHRCTRRRSVAPGASARGRLGSHARDVAACSRIADRAGQAALDEPALAPGPGAVTERAADGAWYAPTVTMGYRYAFSAVVGPVPSLPSTEDGAAAVHGRRHRESRRCAGRRCCSAIDCGNPTAAQHRRSSRPSWWPQCRTSAIPVGLLDVRRSDRGAVIQFRRSTRYSLN
jgi:hypothetical protein